MMSLPQICLMPFHLKEKRAIEYVCLYPKCKLNRFLCSMCLLETIHKHNL